MLREGVKLDGLVFLIEALGFVFFQSPEHLLTFDVVSVNHKIVAYSDVAILLHIGRTQVAVFLFKIVLQIEIRLIGCLHDGIVDIRTLNFNPSHHIGILQKQLAVLWQYAFFLRQRDFGGLAPVLLCLLHLVSNFLKGFRLLVLVCVVVADMEAAKSRRT